MRIWPAIDLRGGKCVRLEQGDYQRETVFGEDPAAMARHWVEQGATCLHLVDLDGARDGQGANRAAVTAIRAAVDVPCQLGGGIRDERTIEHWLQLGLDRLVIGTRAVRDPDWFASVCEQHPGKLVAGIDAKNGLVATDGWLEVSSVAAIDLAVRLSQAPLAAIVYTDIAKDGMLQGPNLEAMAEMNAATDADVVASGGVTTADDVRRLAEIGMAGCIVGRSLYEGRMSLPEALAASGETRGE
ncbi:MAG: 1-(5-phosphoribosyl)-5-[(5-phosphoribosylamino)methylideneamino]imidazole-4-carboxamide isomerase [Planctomycetales bacterium]|nr:1-(5-phosphoribosyl)-5-[(5-phosphoribosylamino)methylideneamino]imidazole-4-carboxamide isomerase [Planctomycetales bacterium]